MNPSARSKCRWKIPYLAKLEINKRASTNCIPFVALTETWLKSYVQDAQLEIGNYNIHRCDREHRTGGGVLLYTHENLPVTNIQKHDFDECQLLMCTCESSKLMICLIYRPPKAPVEKFKACLDEMHAYTDGRDDYDVCFLGDFNFPDVSWDPVKINSPDISSEMLLSFMSDHLYSQYILQPTRLNNILELFITGSHSLVTHISTSKTKLSDHNLVEVFLSYNPCQPSYSSPPCFDPSSFRSLDFNKADFDAINQILSSVDWDSLYKECSEDEFPELFTLILLQASQIGCSIKSPPSRKGNRTLNILSRKKRKLQEALDRAEACPFSPKLQLQSLRNKLALIHYSIRDAIVEDNLYREEQAIAKITVNPKYFYSYAKRFSKQKQSISMLFDKSGSIQTNPDKIANILQDQFTSVFSNPLITKMSSADIDVPQHQHPHTDSQMIFTEADIVDAIDEIRHNAAPGPDEIPPVLLINCKHSVARPIYLIWSTSFSSGIVPSCYKTSIITPLHKKDSRAISSNYRPVSLTSHIIKIFERVVRKKMVAFLESNKLLCANQHGFRTGHSCLTQLLHHFDDVYVNYLNGHDTDSIYLDYAKAFDKVDHALLIKKLRRYGIHSTIIKWVESFLTNRSQQVVIDGHLSLAALIISGVPQGTVLGPILFIIFINDITSCIKDSTIRCFADDTRVSKAITCEEDVQVLQRDLEAVIDWSANNNMSLHEDKFEYMCHSASKSNDLRKLPFVCEFYQYKTSVDILSPVCSLRDLGVLVSHSLSWSSHIHNIADKARQKASWVLSVFHTRSPAVMMSLYKSMVRSLLEFCSPLWNPTKISDIQEVESVQRTFTTRIAGCQDLDYWERLQKLSLMSLQRRRERFIIIHMWKILHGTTSNDLEVQFQLKSRTGTQAVVPSLTVKSLKRHQSLYDSSFAVMGPKLWNSIPYGLNSLAEFDVFKSRLTAFILKVPDKPPVRGYSPPNSNSLLAWRVDKDAAALWGSRGCWRPN